MNFDWMLTFWFYKGIYVKPMLQQKGINKLYSITKRLNMFRRSFTTLVNKMATKVGDYNAVRQDIIKAIPTERYDKGTFGPSM
jgi:predicted patatin/cPLA2 family phospholipase